MPHLKNNRFVLTIANMERKLPLLQGSQYQPPKRKLISFARRKDISLIFKNLQEIKRQKKEKHLAREKLVLKLHPPNNQVIFRFE